MQRTPHTGKIFAIGFYKTGTTTIYQALKVLGYRTINGDKIGSYPGADDGETLLQQIERGDYRLPTFELFDAFTDNPYFHLWREIYAQYPDAKYILTVRVWMFGKHADPGDSAESRQARLDAYRARNAAVREHFCSRPGQFLEFDPTQMHESGPLCEFLGRPEGAGPGGRPIGHMPATMWTRHGRQRKLAGKPHREPLGNRASEMQPHV